MGADNFGFLEKKSFELDYGKMKILLLNPPDDLFTFLGEGAHFIPKFEPLGLLYLAAVCRDQGYAVSVIDAYAEGLNSDEVKKRIASLRPDVIGITVFTSNGGIVLDIGKWIKLNFPEILVILGNIHASVFGEAYLRNGCGDLVVHGEGEVTLRKILTAFARPDRNFKGIPGISLLSDGIYFKTDSGTVESLGELPLPARDLVNQELYNIPSISNLPFSGKKNIIGKHMFTSRGCPRCCTFCVVQKNRKQRFNEIQKTVDEMEILHRQYHADYIFIMDSLFISQKQRVIDICREIRRRNLDIRWGCEGHADFIDEELAVEMEKAGCFDMAFGIESGVQRLLNATKKGTTLDRIRKAVKTVKRNTGIKVSGLFILGLPGETLEDSLQTIDFSKRLPLDMAQFSILVPYPGSQIFNELAASGEIETGVRPDGSLDPQVWQRYSAYISFTGSKPIWVTPALTPELLKDLQKRALREFYFRPRQFFYQLKRVRISELGKTIRLFFKTFF